MTLGHGRKFGLKKLINLNERTVAGLSEAEILSEIVSRIIVGEQCGQVMTQDAVFVCNFHVVKFHLLIQD